MLETLKKYDSNDAQRTLADVVSYLLPDPGIYPETDTQIAGKLLRESVLVETRKTLGLDEEDDSLEARSRILSFLGDQISENVLNQIDLDDVETRLGLKGHISPDRYQINFTNYFRQAMAYFRVTEEEVNQTLTQPNGLQHLAPEKEQDGSPAGASLYVRNFDQGKNKHLLLILSKRKGKTQAPFCAWRVFYSDVDLMTVRTPVEALKAFTDVYGLRFQLGDLRPAKFYLRETVKAPVGLQVGNWLPADKYIKLPGGLADAACCRIERYTPIGFVIFQLVYCVDMKKYRRDLERHGYRLPPKSKGGLRSRNFSW